jgi:hypothetical protein
MRKKFTTDKLGYIKLYRSIEDNKFYFSEPFTYMGAWIDLLILANHSEQTFNIRGNLVVIKRGQVGRSQDTLAQRWKWSRGKVSRYLKSLEIEQQIVQQKSHILSIIQINNYDKFQESNTTDSTTDERQTVQQTDTNNNDNNDKKDKNNTYHEEFTKVWLSYPSSRRREKNNCYSYWKKIPKDKTELFYSKTIFYIMENSKENYKYVKESQRWFKDWETQVDVEIKENKDIKELW